MKSKDLQAIINHKKQVLYQFLDGEKIIGVTIIRANSSDNWLFNDTEIKTSLPDLSSIVPTVTNALQIEIEELEKGIEPLIVAEQDEEQIRLEEEAKQQAKQDAVDLQKEKEDAFILSQQKGNAVIKAYLLDNKELDITTAQSIEQLQKFSVVKSLLELGSLSIAKELIGLAKVDSIFTQERKDKYLNMLQ